MPTLVAASRRGLAWRFEPIAEEHHEKPEAARTRLLELLDGDDYRFRDRARDEGKRALRWLRNRDPTEWEMVEYIVSVLKGTATLRRAPQDDPPGIAWQITDLRNIFVKLQICGGFGQECAQEYVLIKSIHESDYPQ